MKDVELLSKARELRGLGDTEYLVDSIRWRLVEHGIEPTEANIVAVWNDIEQEVIPSGAEDSIKALLDKGELQQQTYEDIRAEDVQEKERVYEQVHSYYLQGKSVSVQEHESGFPAVTIDCDDIHVITDILSLEEWWRSTKQHERPDRECPYCGNELDMVLYEEKGEVVIEGKQGSFERNLTCPVCHTVLTPEDLDKLGVPKCMR